MTRLWIATSIAASVALAPACIVSFEDYPTGVLPDASAGSAGDSGAEDGCAPKTCTELGADCGAISDGCGALLSCGVCNGDCANHVCACQKTSCAAQGKDCGTIPDGCGGTLECGDCPGGQVCGGGGTPNVCAISDAGCVPKSCAEQGKDCGTISDLCGATLSCGACQLGQICADDVCTCLPKTCASSSCGLIDDGCGGQIICGTCAEGKVCNPITHACCLPNPSLCENAECGSKSACGMAISCGVCPSGQSCVSNKCN